jgi:hypothetical protein
MKFKVKLDSGRETVGFSKGDGGFAASSLQETVSESGWPTTAGFARQGEDGGGRVPCRVCREEGRERMNPVCAQSVPARKFNMRVKFQGKAAIHAAFPLVGAPRFELGTSSPPG